jgi:hypothetical protein
VSVDGELIASIGKGILALAAVSKDDTIKDSEKSANKLLNMKLWDDENGGRVCDSSNLSTLNSLQWESQELPSSFLFCKELLKLVAILAIKSRQANIARSGKRASKTSAEKSSVSLNSPSSPPPKRATNPTFTNPPAPTKARNSTRPSSRKCKTYTKRTGSKTGFSRL